MIQRQIFVGNLPWSYDEMQVSELFSAVGEISKIHLPRDHETGRPRGFAFVTFSTQLSAEKALQLDGKDIEGRALKVNVAEQRGRKSAQFAASRPR